VTAAIVVRARAGAVEREYRVDAETPDAALAAAIRFEDAHGRRFAGELAAPAAPARPRRRVRTPRRAAARLGGR